MGKSPNSSGRHGEVHHGFRASYKCKYENTPINGPPKIIWKKLTRLFF
jgi:hypothetical protein